MWTAGLGLPVSVCVWVNDWESEKTQILVV